MNVLLRKGRRVLTGTISPLLYGEGRRDSGTYRMVDTVAMNARVEWWQWKGWHIEVFVARKQS